MKVPRKKRPGRVLAFEEKSTEIEMYKTTETLWKKAHWQLIQERWEALMKRRTTAGSHTNGCMVEYSEAFCRSSTDCRFKADLKLSCAALD